MRKLEDCRMIFVVVSFVGAVTIASPALASILPSRATERFSELYVLGPNRMAEGYASDVKPGETFKIYLGVGNHMGSSALYGLHVKLRNRGEPLPNSTAGTPSPLPAIYGYRVFLGDGGVWETPLEFSFRDLSFSGNSCRVGWLALNGVAFPVDKTALWDSEGGGFFLQLFFELWIYDPKPRVFSFHNRFVGIWLNVTG